MDDAPAPDAARTPPGQRTGTDDAEPIPAESDPVAAQFNPFPFGAPTPDSPVAAAFPEIYPAAVPIADSNQPPSGAPYPQPSASPWAQPSSQQPTSPPPWLQPPSPQPPVSQPWTPQPPYPAPQPVPGYGPAGSAYPPGYPAQYPGAQYPGAQYPGPQATNGKAIAGLVLGIVSLALFFLTVFDVPLIVLGIVFSALGLRAARRGEGRRAMALAGLICSVVAAVVVTVALTYFVSRGHTCEQRYDRGSTGYNNCLLHLN